MNNRPKNNYLLAIESATSVCSVALFHGGTILNELSTSSPRNHNEKLALMVNELCQDSSVNFEDVSHIAVSIGPGSFTGLRVGLSFAKGIALGTGCQIIPVNTLEALAMTIYQQHLQSTGKSANRCTIFAATVARKIESFGVLCKFDGLGIFPIVQGEIKLFKVDELSSLKIDDCVIGGEGIDNLISGMYPEEYKKYSPISDVKASAIAVGEIALKSIGHEDGVPNVLSMEPKYINEFTVHQRIA